MEHKLSRIKTKVSQPLNISNMPEMTTPVHSKETSLVINSVISSPTMNCHMFAKAGKLCSINTSKDTAYSCQIRISCSTLTFGSIPLRYFFWHNEICMYHRCTGNILHMYPRLKRWKLKNMNDGLMILFYRICISFTEYAEFSSKE